MGNRNDSRRGNENRTPVPRVVATASNNSRRGTYSRAGSLRGDRNASPRRRSATSSNDPAQTHAISTAHPPSGTSAQTPVVSTASNNSRRDTKSRAESLQGDRNASPRRTSATSSNDPAQTHAISTAHPPSGPSAQPLPVRTASNNSRRGTNSRAEALQGGRDASSRRSSATSSNDPATTLANSSAHPPSN